MTDLTGYLAAPGFEADLRAELGDVVAEYGRLMLAPGAARPAVWAQNIWHEPQIIEISSIKDGAARLKAIQRNWALYDYQLHRRAKLIEENLPHVSSKPVVFPSPLPTAPLGSWTLIEDHKILASARCASPFRNGEVNFVENKDIPPSRAYLKLWEFITLAPRRPQAGELCLDLGSCPGGWTWVLQTLGCKVIAVDKAPLAPHIASLPNIEYREGSAFALEPRTHAPVDWLFSDMACYPERLLKLVQRWIEADKARNYCCTIKLQGDTDFDAIRAFAAIPGSKIQHLSCNKHELTWSLLRQ